MPTPEEDAAVAAAEAARVAAEAQAEADRKAADDERKKLSDPDHASRVIAKANAEAKQHRERAEKAERELADAAKNLKEREEKELADKEEFKTLAERREKELNDERAARAAERAETHAILVREAVAREAVKAGISDEDDIDLPAFKEALALAKVENGRVVGVAEAVAKMKEYKPAKFKAAETDEQRTEREERERSQQRDEQGRFQRPDPQRDANSAKNVDAAKLKDDDFDALTARLRAQRV